MYWLELLKEGCLNRSLPHFQTLHKLLHPEREVQQAGNDVVVNAVVFAPGTQNNCKRRQAHERAMKYYLNFIRQEGGESDAKRRSNRP